MVGIIFIHLYTIRFLHTLPRFLVCYLMFSIPEDTMGYKRQDPPLIEGGLSNQECIVPMGPYKWVLKNGVS